MSARFLVTHDPKKRTPTAAKAALLSDAGMDDLALAYARYLRREPTRLPRTLELPPGRCVFAMGSSGELIDAFNRGWRGMEGVESTERGEDLAVWYARTQVRVGYTATIFFVTAARTPPVDGEPGRAEAPWQNAKDRPKTFVKIDNFLNEYIPRAKGVKAFV